MTLTLQAIAWTLVHFCWQAAAIAVVYRIAAFALARRSSQARYLAAVASLLLMLTAAVTTFGWEMRNASSVSTPSTAQLNMQYARNTGEFPRTTAPGMIAEAQSNASNVSFAALMPWIDGMWLIGVLALSIRSLGGWWLIHRLRASSTAQAPASALASFDRICNVMGIHRPVLLRVSNAIAGPITVGALRALVLLPISAVTLLSPDELEVVLAHELAHVRRADFFWNLVQTVAETLFFFHPAVWWISGLIRHERELCCDDLALMVCPNPVVYAHALFRLEQQRSRQWRLAMALDGNQSPQTLRVRIARILGEPVARISARPARPLSLAAATAALVVLLLPGIQFMTGIKPAQAAATQPVIAAALAPENMHPLVASVASTPKPSPKPQQAAPEPAPSPAPQEQRDTESDTPTHPDPNYIDRMKAAGYDIDLDKLIAMKIQEVTPEYAKAMGEVGFGKPTADDLIACKIQGVTPEYITQLKQQGLEVKSFQEAISYRIFSVTPEFASGMKAAGFDNLTGKEMLSMRVQGVTPEFAREMKQSFPAITAGDLVKARIFHIDAAFIAEAKKHGFNNLSFDKLVQLSISGILDDESK